MTHETPIRVDHVGIAAPSIPETEPVLWTLGCEKLAEESAENRFRWAYYRLGSASRLERIAPEREGSFLTEFLDRHGTGLHHVTLEVADVGRVVERLESTRLGVVEHEKFDDWTEAFVSPRNATGTPFQLMEYHEGDAEHRRAGSAMYVGGRRLGGDGGRNP